MTADLPIIDIDFHNAAALLDPYPLYERVRNAGRVVRNTRTSTLLVTGYEDAVAVFRDLQSFSSRAVPDRIASDFPPMTSLISTDPPAHSRLRMAMRPLFAIRAVRSRESHAQDALRTLANRSSVSERLYRGDTVDV